MKSAANQRVVAVVLATALTVACSRSALREDDMPQCETVGPSFLNDGGPLLVLSAHLLSEWDGTPLDADDPVSGDYGRACDVEVATGLLNTASGTAVAVACDDLYYPMRWVRHGDSWIVVGWTYGEDDADDKLLAAMRTNALPAWEPVRDDLPVQGGLVLFHAASAGEDFSVPTAASGPVGLVTTGGAKTGHDGGFATIGDALVASVPDGRYDLSYVFVELDDDNACALWRWSPR